MVWQVMFINRLKGAFKMSSNIVLDVRRVEKNYNTTTQEGKENIFITEYKNILKSIRSDFCEKIRFLIFQKRKEQIFV